MKAHLSPISWLVLALIAAAVSPALLTYGADDKAPTAAMAPGATDLALVPDEAAAFVLPRQ